MSAQKSPGTKTSEWKLTVYLQVFFGFLQTTSNSLLTSDTFLNL